MGAMGPTASDGAAGEGWPERGMKKGSKQVRSRGERAPGGCLQHPGAWHLPAGLAIIDKWENSFTVGTRRVSERSMVLGLTCSWAERRGLGVDGERQVGDQAAGTVLVQLVRKGMLWKGAWGSSQ